MKKMRLKSEQIYAADLRPGDLVICLPYGLEYTLVVHVDKTPKQRHKGGDLYERKLTLCHMSTSQVFIDTWRDRAIFKLISRLDP